MWAMYGYMPPPFADICGQRKWGFYKIWDLSVRMPLNTNQGLEYYRAVRGVSGKIITSDKLDELEVVISSQGQFHPSCKAMIKERAQSERFGTAARV